MEGAYLDHASATPVRKEVLEAMLPYFSAQFANPSNVYDLGSKIKETIEEARSNVASLINADPAQIVFTSSGAEANNLAIKGVAFARQKKGNHVIVSSIEHHSVLNSVRFLERLDFEATFLPVDKYGLVDACQHRDRNHRAHFRAGGNLQRKRCRFPHRCGGIGRQHPGGC